MKIKQNNIGSIQVTIHILVWLEYILYLRDHEYKTWKISGGFWILGWEPYTEFCRLRGPIKVFFNRYYHRRASVDFFSRQESAGCSRMWRNYPDINMKWLSSKLLKWGPWTQWIFRHNLKIFLRILLLLFAYLFYHLKYCIFTNFFWFI